MDFSINIAEQATHPLPTDVHKKYFEVQVAEFIELYIAGFLLFIGVFGNGMTLVILARKRMRATTMSVYLSTAAVGDMVTLVLGQAGRHWIRNLTGVDLTSLATWYCSLWLVIINLGTSLSSFSLAGVAAERCLAISSPLRSRRIICKRSAYIYSAAITVISAGYGSHSFWTYHVKDMGGRSICGLNAANYFGTKVRVWTDFLYLFAIPAGIIAISNLILIFQVIKAKTKRDSWLAENKNDKNQTVSTIAMLVSVCVVYIILLSPIRISYFIGSVFLPGFNVQTKEAGRMKMLWSISLCGYYVNYSTNFFIYIVSGNTVQERIQ